MADNHEREDPSAPEHSIRAGDKWQAQTARRAALLPADWTGNLCASPTSTDNLHSEGCSHVRRAHTQVAVPSELACVRSALGRAPELNVLRFGDRRHGWARAG
eukprot:6436887-Prymnesium_polylepis.1